MSLNKGNNSRTVILEILFSISKRTQEIGSHLQNTLIDFFNFFLLLSESAFRIVSFNSLPFSFFIFLHIDICIWFPQMQEHVREIITSWRSQMNGYNFIKWRWFVSIYLLFQKKNIQENLNSSNNAVCIKWNVRNKNWVKILFIKFNCLKSK